MSNLIVTIDIDWACEVAIEETLSFLEDIKIVPTVFTTHNSPIINSVINKIEIGLHPNFELHSSHGSTIAEVVSYVMDLPHNIAAYRCHRYAVCNASKQAMLEAGMLLSSNVCTDLEIVPSFKDRFGIIEIPIFLEDGGYLWRRHPVQMNKKLQDIILDEGTKVINIHPMHFVINTPCFSYMYDIKQSMSRTDWNDMTKNDLNKLRYKGVGIRDLLIEILRLGSNSFTLSSYLHKVKTE